MEQRNHLGPIPWDLQRARCFSWAEKLALIVLWGRADASGECRTAMPTLASDIPCSLNIARAAVNGLVTKGVITVGRTGRANYFVVLAEAVMEYIRTNRVFTSEQSDRADPNDQSMQIRTIRSVESEQSDHSDLHNKEEPRRSTLKEELREEEIGAPDRRARSAPKKIQTWGDFPDQEAFTQAALKEFGPLLGFDDTHDIIMQALAHDSVKKTTRLDIYVRRTWLLREARRIEAERERLAAYGRNGNGTNGRSPPPAPGRQPEKLRDYTGGSTGGIWRNGKYIGPTNADTTH